MKIWMINHYALPPRLSGSTRHFCLARELIARGHKVKVISASFDHLTGERIKLVPGEKFRFVEDERVPFLWVRTPTCSRHHLSRIWNMVRFAIRVGKGMKTQSLAAPDVILGSSPHLFGALASKRLAERLSVPFVLEVRDLWPETLIKLGNVSSWHPFVLLLAWIEKHLYLQANRIITLLPKSEEYIVQKGAKAELIEVVPNGVDLTHVPSLIPPSEGDNPFTVMYAGAHNFANGLDLILDAAILLKKDGWGHRVRFLLMGYGPEKSRLQKRVRDEGIVNVQFHEAVPKSQVYPILQQAHAFILPLLDSPLFYLGVSPNKLFDYMALARPIIFAVSSPFNPVEASGTGLTVSPKNIPAVAEAVKKLVQMSPSARWEMGLNGRNYVEKYHSFPILATALEKVFIEAVKEYPSSLK